MNILNAWYTSGGMIFVYVLLIFGAIAVIAYLLYKFVLSPIRAKEQKDQEEVKTEQQLIEDELSRVLETVEDESIAEQIKDYNEENDK